MSVPNQTPYIIYNANGLTTVFPFEFYIINAGDIQVSINGTTVTSGYSVSGTGNVGGGEVTFITPPASGSVVMLERVVPTYRLTDYQDNGDLLADTVNKDFDRLWMAIQRSFIYLGLALRRPLLGGPFNAEGYRIANLADPVNENDAATKNYVDSQGNALLNRTLRVPENSVPALPPASLRANKMLAFNDQGNPIVVLPPSSSASDVLIELAKSTGSDLIGHKGHTVGQYLNGIGRMVFPGDDLKAVLESANEGDTVIISGDVSLNQSVVVQKAVPLKRVNGGRILWNGPGINCIRYNPPVKKTITAAVQFLQGYNSASFPDGHGLVVGDCLEAHSTSVRFTDLSGSNYTRGQFFFVESVSGNTVVFTPGVIEGFTSSEIIVTNSLRGMDFDVEIVTTKAPTGTATGVLLDIRCARDMTGKFRIKGNEDEQYGLAVTGHNNHFDVDVWGITSGYGQVSVPGYGVNVVGTDMRITGSGGRCRHVFEIPAGNVLSANIEFDMHIVKSANTPQFLYAAGAHANAVGWKARGSVSGSGYLIGDRTGTADISMDFFRVDDGYEYADIYLADIHPYASKIHNCRTFGDTARKNFVYYDCSSTIRNGATLAIENNFFRGPVRIIQFKNNAAVTNPTYAAIIRNNSGQAVAFTNRDMPGASVTLTIEGNKIGSYGITTTFGDYMLGIDQSGCKSYELHFHHNLIDDTLPNGVLQLQGSIDNLNLDSSYCSNGTKPLFNIAPSYLGAISGFSVDHAKTGGLMTFTIPTTTVWNAAGNVSFCDVKYDSATPVSSTNVPIVFTGMSFKTTLDATLVSSKRPQGGNVNLSGKAINWNGTNIAI
ncbi:hypothetical protein LH668_04525 [Enterobacter kobei]|uniref:phage tail fiber domain-containing protein n=1 Tax=Enterobacter kobei TaxID=208224 RepID=UPI001EEF1BE3|nr:phage tail fiber protein [Enterobacter kobei]MCF1286175.1 hypothetical protein [Enterobacter kobei]HDR2393694.1 hypothetical protein [Enterobacter kobei]